MPSGLGNIAILTSIRMQLNPIGGVHRKRAVENTLSADPILEELLIKQAYLLVGSNGLSRLTLKSFLEMAGFFVTSLPVPIALLLLYKGWPVGIDWLQLWGHAIGYTGLTAIWVLYVKRVHLRTYKLFDEAIARHKLRKALGLPI
jgi:hypothetical protein